MKVVSVPVVLMFRVPDDTEQGDVAAMAGNALEWSTARDALDAACESRFATAEQVGNVDDWPGYDGHSMEPPTVIVVEGPDQEANVVASDGVVVYQLDLYPATRYCDRGERSIHADDGWSDDVRSVADLADRIERPLPALRDVADEFDRLVAEDAERPRAPDAS